jgi:hypothetical protein
MRLRYGEVKMSKNSDKKDMRKILKDMDQWPNHYVALRIQLVEVKKYPIIGFIDNNIGATTFIPNTPVEAFDVFEKFKTYIDKFAESGDFIKQSEELPNE